MDKPKQEHIITSLVWWTLILFALTLILVIGCSDNDNVAPTVSEEYITVFPTIDTGIHKLTGNEFEENDAIGVYVVPYDIDNNSTPGSIENASSANAEHIFHESSWLLPSGGKLPWPAPLRPVDIYSYFPYDAGLDNLSPVQYPFTVQADQRTSLAYQQSDFLWSETTNVSPTRQPIELVFSHRLSKVKVNVRSEIDIPEADLQSAIISILGVNASATIDLSNGNATLSPGAPTTDIITFRHATPAMNYLISTEAIIVPQQAAAGQAFIRIDFPTNGTRYNYTPDTPIPFNPGTERAINITLTSQGLSVTVSDVIDWQPSEVIEGEINTPIYRVVDLSTIDWDTSYIHHIYDDGIRIADVCREFIRTGSGTEAGVQAIVVYPVDDQGNLDVSTGFVPQELYFNRPLYTPITLNRHGGRVNWTSVGANPSYTTGTSAPITRILFGRDGSITAAPDNYPVTLQTAPYLLTDIDNNTYGIVKIGWQYWIRENLRTTRYNNGEALTAYNPDNNEANATVYGKLYTWDVMMDDNGIAPDGWRLFTTTDFNVLYSYIQGYAGRKLKSNYRWNRLTQSTDITGFSALGAGNRLANNNYNNLNNYGYWWTTNRGTGNPTHYQLYSGSYSIITQTNQPVTSALSVRLIRED